MKKLMIWAAALCLLLSAALAEEPQLLLPYVVEPGEEMTVEIGDASVTYAQGNTRIVAQYFSRVPDEDSVLALQRLMREFDSEAQELVPLAMAEGFAGLQGVSVGQLDENVRRMTVMVLREGQLLILSGYDLDDDVSRLSGMMRMLLERTTLNGEPLLDPPEEASDAPEEPQAPATAEPSEAPAAPTAE